MGLAPDVWVPRRRQPEFATSSLSRELNGTSLTGQENLDHAVGYMISIPRCSMSDIFAYIWLIYMVNVGKYTIH